MPRTLARSVVAAAAVLAFGPLAVAQTGQLAAKNGWLSDYPAARAAAKRTGKPIFLVFRCEP